MNQKQPIKFIVQPGYIISKSDRDKHFISFNELCSLYNLNPREVIDFDGFRGHLRHDPYAIYLRPDYDGDYNIANEVTKQIHSTWMPLGRNEGILNTKKKLIELTFLQRLWFTISKKLPVEVFKYGHKLR